MSHEAGPSSTIPLKLKPLEHASFVTQFSSVDSHVRHKKSAASLLSSSPFSSLSPETRRPSTCRDMYTKNGRAPPCHNHQSTRHPRDGVSGKRDHASCL